MKNEKNLKMKKNEEWTACHIKIKKHESMFFCDIMEISNC